MCKTCHQIIRFHFKMQIRPMELRWSITIISLYNNKLMGLPLFNHIRAQYNQFQNYIEITHIIKVTGLKSKKLSKRTGT